MGRQSKWEYLRAVYVRYRWADRRGKQRILDEFCANTRYHRKHALRLLNGLPRALPANFLSCADGPIICSPDTRGPLS
jgi:hypothetical protein